MEAGMDEFLTKPIHLKDLATLVQAGRPQRTMRPHLACPISGDTPDQAVLDQVRVAALAELGVDAREDVLGQLIDSFLASCDQDFATMLEAASQDRRRLSEVAHRLAGRSSNLGLNRVAAVCRKLELVADSAEPRHLIRMLQGLGEELDEAAKALVQRRADAEATSGAHPQPDPVGEA
jgi:HPt (histidine-containing phosphotransfer) domain-containing protein